MINYLSLWKMIQKLILNINRDKQFIFYEQLFQNSMNNLENLILKFKNIDSKELMNNFISATKSIIKDSKIKYK